VQGTFALDVGNRQVRMEDNGSFSSSLTFRSTALASRDAFAKTPLPFGGGICCLAGFLGDSWHLGCNPGLDGRAKSREIVGDLRTILGRNFSHLSDSRTGLIMGESHEEDNGERGSETLQPAMILHNEAGADTNTHTLYSQKVQCTRY